MTYIYRLTIYDHTQLGGPMGVSYSIPVVATENFNDYAGANQQFQKIAKTRKVVDHLPAHPKLNQVYDYRSFGMQITRERVTMK
jgi:hypothetical protein